MATASSSKTFGPAIASLAVIVIPVVAAAAIVSTFSLPPQVKTMMGALAALFIVAGAFALLRRSPLKIKGEHLLVRASLGYQRIPLSKITGVSKVRRKKKSTRGPAEERVEITYTADGDSHALLLSPPDAMQFVLELVSHCPQLSAYQETRLIKDASFKDALADDE